MVSGSDAHGTPITVRADAEGTTALEVYQRFHAGFLELFQQLGLTYDLFTSTHTANHFDVSQKIFLALKQNGYLYTDRQLQWYAPSRTASCPTGMWKAPAISAGIPTRAATSAINAATCSTRRN